MSFPTYVDPIPLPPPTASATTVSYTDPLGDVWVAKNGVNGGNWFRARDVLYCRVQANAALTLTTAAANVLGSMAAAPDAYGMVASPNITVPVAGLYDIRLVITASPAAAGWIGTRIYRAAASVGLAWTWAHSSVASALSCMAFWMGPLAAGETVQFDGYANASLAWSNNYAQCFGELAYRGTG